MKQRQKQAAVILHNAYLHGLNADVNQNKSISPSFVPTLITPPVFNHLLMGPALARDGCLNNRPTTLSGGAVQLAATVIQPLDYSARVSRANSARPNFDSSARALKNGHSIDAHQLTSKN
ncbi:hypothetical protein OSTOST_25243, partial [Ostertagia ostertagi]